MPETSLREPPVLPMPLIGRIWRGLRDPLGFLVSLEAQYGDIVTLRSGRSYAIFHPDYVKQVLQENYANYEKGEKYRAALSPLMGNGLFTSEGAFWLRQRRIAQGAFQKTQLPVFGDHILACVVDMIADWERKARAHEPVPLREALTELTLRATLRMLFGVDAQAEMPALIAAVHARQRRDQVRTPVPARAAARLGADAGAPAVRAIAADDRRVRLSHHPAAAGGVRSGDRPGRPAGPRPGSGDRRAHGRSPASRRGRHHAERRPRHRDRRHRVDARAPGPAPRGPGARARRGRADRRRRWAERRVAAGNGTPGPRVPRNAPPLSAGLGLWPDGASIRTRSASTRCRRAVS